MFSQNIVWIKHSCPKRFGKVCVLAATNARNEIRRHTVATFSPSSWRLKKPNPSEKCSFQQQVFFSLRSPHLRHVVLERWFQEIVVRNRAFTSAWMMVTRNQSLLYILQELSNDVHQISNLIHAMSVVGICGSLFGNWRHRFRWRRAHTISQTGCLPEPLTWTMLKGLSAELRIFPPYLKRCSLNNSKTF